MLADSYPNCCVASNIWTLVQQRLGIDSPRMSGDRGPENLSGSSWQSQVLVDLLYLSTIDQRARPRQPRAKSQAKLHRSAGSFKQLTYLTYVVRLEDR
jgi:hypothetical protein